MKKRMVKYEIDLSHPPTLTAAQTAELKALRAKSDSEIDYRDIPQLKEDFWKKAVRNPFYRPTKTSTTVRIDSDVLGWLRAYGKGYQSRINAILRREMLAQDHWRKAGWNSESIPLWSSLYAAHAPHRKPLHFWRSLQNS
jgi:uncharacterized protein (DUF4415 family)